MLQPGQILDRYIVEATLGEGGMASVYRVRHATLGSKHALKVLHVEGRGITERLLAEGRVQAGLDHPNALVVTDVIDVDGAPGLVMEFVDGGSLEDWVETSPTREQRVAVFRAVCDAVAAAHRAGWIHRDLKPANVLVKTSGATIIPKVADFGLVKALVGAQPHDGPQTRDGLAMGTPGYMAPEQIENAAQVDARADVYSLGCLLIWLVSGEPAFDGTSTLDLFTAVAAGDHRTLSPGDPLAHVVERCLQRNPDDRYADAEELLHALDTPVEPSRPAVRAATLSGATIASLLAAGVAVAAAGLFVVLVLVVSTGWLSSSNTLPADDEVPVAAGCPIGDDGRIGWIRGALPRMTSIPDPFVLTESTPVYAEMDRTSATVCTLPIGSSIDVNTKWRRPLGEAFWIAVDAERLTSP